jgi:hypothetical protein
MWCVFHNARWYWSDNLCKLVTDQWRGSLGVRDSESCWFTKKIDTYMHCWETDIMFLKRALKYKWNRLIGSYIRSWERPGDLPRVIEILCLFFREWSAAKRAKRNKNFYHEWKITQAFPTMHVSIYFFRKPTTFTIANS